MINNKIHTKNILEFLVKNCVPLEGLFNKKILLVWFKIYSLDLIFDFSTFKKEIRKVLYETTDYLKPINSLNILLYQRLK
jgi:hypothetical protein